MKQIPKRRTGVGNPVEFSPRSHATDIRTTAPGTEYSCAIHGVKLCQALPHLTAKIPREGSIISIPKTHKLRLKEVGKLTLCCIAGPVWVQDVNPSPPRSRAYALNRHPAFHTYLKIPLARRLEHYPGNVTTGQTQQNRASLSSIGCGGEDKL